MAFTQATLFSFTVIDAMGVKASAQVYALADPTKTITNLAADWQTWAGLIDAIIGGQILHGTARLILVPSGDEKSSPAAGSVVEQTGLFTMANADNDRLYGEDVPSLADSKITGGRINLADSDVLAFVTALGTATANTEPTTNNFLPLTDLAHAAVTFRKHRRGLSRVSFEV